ncbi:MAG: beta-lactamase family protein [Defluviitaleaceae bacterium]|nr:beta-lactamase family protein [Defluviitaleaceae bacterium]
MDKLQSILEKTMSKHLLPANGPGYSVSVTLDSKTIFKHYSGYANLDHDIPINRTTVFGAASLAKQFTACCIAILVCEGRIDLDEPIKKYFPEYSEKITVRHIIYHTAGIQPKYEPGERDIYYNDGYDLLAGVIETVTGMNEHDYAKQKIFDPLKMENTHFHVNEDVVIKNAATAYKQTGSKSYAYNADIDGFELFDNRQYPACGSDGLWTTADDLTVWHNCFMDRKLPGASNGLFELLFSPFTLNNGRLNQFGFGFFYDKNDRGIIWQHGDCSGWQGVMRVYLKKRLSVIVLSNLRQAKPVDLAVELENDVIGALFDMPKQINYLTEYWDARNKCV